ncbi:cell division protein FtsQ/DivIB [Loigolactobacillus iwatensis]|uniref:cell division protein FtsQ/DivIB n=1 Tax=Loigolactobacillus iwatensis TaxID=1267156 RepID=UPI000F7E7AED|nr:cell division protein FtsQ/DivIB [Loigolactobacillus iwatensis]
MRKKWLKKNKQKKIPDDPASALTPWETYQKKQKQQSKKTNTIESKLPRLKELRHHHLVNRLVILLVTFVIIILVAGYFVSPISKVGNVQVANNGKTTLSTQSVIDASGIKASDLVISTMLHQTKISQRAKQAEPKIKQFSLSISGLHSVTLHVTEYKTVGILLKNNRYYPILANGRVTSSGSGHQIAGNYSVYSNFKRQQTLQKMVQQYNQLPSDVQNGISEIHFAPTKLNPKRIHLYMNDGNQVYATLESFSKKMRYYPSIAKQMKKKGVVNLEVGAYSYPFK